MNSKRSLVTGCGRSGTLYVTNLLRALGYDMRHERSDGEGAACWYCCGLLEKNVRWEAPITRCGCQFPGVRIDEFGDAVSDLAVAPIVSRYDVILHQTRAPMAVIASAQTFTEGSFNYIGNKIGSSGPRDRILEAARYWIEWNRTAARIADYSYRVEDMPAQIPHICERIGIPYSEDRLGDLLLRKDINARLHDSVDAVYIRKRDAELYRELRRTADRLGYSI